MTKSSEGDLNWTSIENIDGPEYPLMPPGGANIFLPPLPLLISYLGVVPGPRQEPLTDGDRVAPVLAALLFLFVASVGGH